MKKLKLIVLISGRGSNLKAIVEQADPLIDLQLVISNRPQAEGLIWAHQKGIPTAVIDHSQYPNRDTFDQALQTKIDHCQPDLIALAGFMRILSPQFVSHYRGRLINIHPSLLPAFKGLHTHQRVLEAKQREHGATVHFVTEELDGGPIILQAKVPVLPEDTEEQLATRVLQQEHRIYPQAIHWFAEGKIQLRGNQVWIANQSITSLSS